MARKKETLLDKLLKKDYNNNLEEVLTKKAYKEEVKNLLLDILYKIEVSYKDYETVKKNVLPKEEYIENIIKSVKNNCKTIKFIRPNDEKKAVQTVNKEKHEIQCYPIARKLLYCLSKIQKSDDIIKEEPEILNKTLTSMINIGNNINTVEPLRDFNGYSWNISILDIENYYYNLVYQDLIILVGNKMLEEWTNKHDIMVDYTYLFKESIAKKYGKKITTEVLELLRTISLLLELTTNKDFKDNMLTRKKEVATIIEEMEDRQKYLEELTKKKKKLTNQIREIDIILNDKEKLAIEYSTRNKGLPLEKKIFSKRVLKIKMEEEREALMKELQECTYKMNSKNFLQMQKDLKHEIKYLEIVDTEKYEKKALEKIILLQKRILQALEVKTENATNKEEMVKVLYELRYFNLIPISENKNIEKVTKLKKMLKETKQKAIIKACKLKVINEVCKDKQLNAEVLEFIFSLNIIRIEDINLKIVKDKENNIFLQFYDDNIEDEKFELDLDLKKEDLKTRFNKKTKVTS